MVAANFSSAPTMINATTTTPAAAATTTPTVVRETITRGEALWSLRWGRKRTGLLLVLPLPSAEVPANMCPCTNLYLTVREEGVAAESLQSLASATNSGSERLGNRSFREAFEHDWLSVTLVADAIGKVLYARCIGG